MCHSLLFPHKYIYIFHQSSYTEKNSNISTYFYLVKRLKQRKILIYDKNIHFISGSWGYEAKPNFILYIFT